MGWLTKIKQIPLADVIFDSKFHPTKSNILVCATVSGDLFILDTDNNTNPIAVELNDHHSGSPIRKIAFTDDHNIITAAKTLKVTDFNTGKVIRKIKPDEPRSKIFSLLVIDHWLVCAGDDEGRFRAWDYRVDRGTFMDLKQCEDHISDLDIDSQRKIVVASSGEGTLTAFNIRSRRMEEPQSELFDAGFQCVRYYEHRGKVLVGAEDSAINIFNIGQWGNISDRFPIKTRLPSRKMAGNTIDSMELIADDKYVVLGCSDGYLRLLTVLPNKVIATAGDHQTGIESLTVNKNTNVIASTDHSTIHLHQFEEQKEPEKPSTSSSNFFSEL
ncbi:WD repeat-containing protein 55 homolog [Tetranychus urticae]|uniref:WD repeat-containing protein 55 homolog n=1 Tax=Tetranychus urticae TaxID=32264 RepID=T1K4R8_TETUR|nr:WD repeat-containing protein 55 homolog [Tetranychus urticae]